MDGSINTQFLSVLSSLGYSQEESRSYSETFDIPRKIQTIASAYSFSQRKSKIAESLDELKSRNSLINLLFLRFTLETMGQLNEKSKEDLWDCFTANEGVSVLEYCFNSNNKDFVENLMEFVIFIQKEKKICGHFISKILKKHSLIDKRLLIVFINLKDKIHTVIKDEMNSNVVSFLRSLVVEILSLDKIKDEFNFLLDDQFDITQVLKKDEIESIRDKFIDKSVYDTIRSRFNSNIKHNVDSNVEPAVSRIKDSVVMVGEKISSINLNKNTSDCRINKEDKIIKNTSDCRINKEDKTIKNTSDRCPKAVLKYPDTPSVSGDVSFFDRSNEIYLKEIENLKMENQMLRGKLSKALSENNLKIKFTKNILTKTVDCSQSKTVVDNSKDTNNNVSPATAKIGFKGAGLFGKKSTNTVISNNTTPANATISANVTTTSNTLSTNTTTASNTITTNATTPINTTIPTNTTPTNVASNTNTSSTPSVAKMPAGKVRFGMKSKSTPQKFTLVSDKSYKGLKWKKSNKSQCQIFSKINYEEYEKKFDLEEFDKFIYKNDLKTSNVSSTTSSNNNNNINNINSDGLLMDPKKSYALNIALGRVKLSNSELISQILGEEYDNENVVRQLIIYFPTDQEYDLIKEHPNTAALGRAEQLIRSIFDLKKFHKSLLSLRFNFMFKAKDYNLIIKRMTEVFRRIVESPELMNLFGSLLVMGNILNSNTFNGNAEGFSLDSLSSFSDREMIDLIKKKVNIPKLILELTGKQDGTLAGVENMENLIHEIGEMKSLFGDFVGEEVSSKYKLVCSDFEELMNVYKEAQLYFGESDDKFIYKIEQFLKLFPK